MSKLYQLVIWRGSMTFDEPFPQADSIEGICELVKKAAKKPFVRIEIEDVSHWNSSRCCSITLTENCPTMDPKG